jgi:5-methylcytosine-specific restriction endonuclease McrA
MKNTPRDRHANGGQGMNWIRKEKRLAIYLRDGLACCYCGGAVEDGAKLTLDHIKCHDHGGSNDATNLVTCCHSCNSARGARSVPVSTDINNRLNAAKVPSQWQNAKLVRVDKLADPFRINFPEGIDGLVQISDQMDTAAVTSQRF